MTKPLPKGRLMLLLMKKFKLGRTELANKLGISRQLVTKNINNPSKKKESDTSLRLLRFCAEHNCEEEAERFIKTYTGGEVMRRNGPRKPRARILPGR